MMTRSFAARRFAPIFITLLWIFLIVVPVHAQEEDEIHFASDDNAVQFSYPSEWTMESQSSIFNQVYRFELWTHSSAMANYITNQDRSRILVEVINPLTRAFPDTLVYPRDYAEFLLSDTTLLAEERNVAGYPAVRVIPAVSSMPTQAPIIVRENFGTPVVVPPLGAGDEAFHGVIYVVVRDDGWIMSADLAAPPSEASHGESVMLALLESLEFDAQAAAIPYAPDLPVYDVSEVALDQHFTSEDMLFSLQYPSSWGIAEYGELGYPQQIAFSLSFSHALPADEIVIMVFDATSEGIGLPLDLNSPQEVMRATRQANPGMIGSGSLKEIEEYRIADNDAVSVITEVESLFTQMVFVALNDSWVAAAYVHASALEILDELEPEVIAAMASIRLALGESYIESPVIRIVLPEEWVFSSYEHESEDTYVFSLRPPATLGSAGPFIDIILIDMAPNFALNLLYRIQGLAALVEMVAGQICQVEGMAQPRSVGEYEIMLVDCQIRSLAATYYQEYNGLIVNETWFALLMGTASSMDDAQVVHNDIDLLIERAEFVLPGSAPWSDP